MNKQQKALLGNDYGFALLPFNFSEAITNHCNYNYKNSNIENVLSVSIGKLGKFWKFIEGTTYLHFNENEEIIISQNKGQDNACLIPLLKGIEKVVVHFKNEKKEYLTEKSVFKNIDICIIDFDFKNAPQKIELRFNFDLTEPLIVNIRTNKYQETKLNLSKELLYNLSLSHSCGQNLVNIKFQLADETVVLTKISLFDNNQRLMATYKINKGTFFKSINDLAYGKYFYKVTQYDKNNNLVIESNYIEFVLSAPYYGKPFILN